MVLGLLLVGVMAFAASSHEVVFERGHVRCLWSEDARSLLLEVEVDPVLSDSYVWVVTAAARRFEDGVFAWQMHFSELLDSIVVVPNDFLTVRRFSLEQLQIAAVTEEPGRRLTIRLPVDGPIPNLVYPGDTLQVHALWIQQRALASIEVPAMSMTMGGGGGTDTVPNVEVTDEQDLVPSIERVVRGQVISHRFRLPEEVQSAQIEPIALNYTLLRLHAAGVAEFSRYAQITYDDMSGIHSYTIDTESLEPGRYRLIIGSSGTQLLSHGLALSVEFELDPLSP